MKTLEKVLAFAFGAGLWVYTAVNAPILFMTVVVFCAAGIMKDSF